MIENAEELPRVSQDAIEEVEESNAFLLQAYSDDLDTVLLRFLRARKWDLSAAFAMIAENIEWRLQYGVHELKKQGELRLPRKLMASGKGFVWGEDQSGRIVCYVRAGLHDKNAQPLEESADYLVYWMETGRGLRRYDEQTCTLVLDLGGASYASMDVGFTHFLLKCLEAYYPEVLGQALLIDAPWIFWGFWKLFSHLMDPVVAAKIKFLKRSELKKYIDPDQIPTEFGGSSGFSFPEAHQMAPPAKPAVSQREDPQKLALIRQMELEFLQITGDMWMKLKTTGGAMGDIDGMLPLEEKRNALKWRIRQQYRELMAPIYPANIYERLGLIGLDGVVDWDRYQAKLRGEDECSSAPPRESILIAQSPADSKREPLIPTAKESPSSDVL